MIYSGNYTIWPYVNKIIEQSMFLKMQSIYFQKCDGQFFFKRAERQKSYVSVPLQERSITCRPNAVHTSVRRYITWDGSEISLELSRYLRGAPGTRCCHFRTSYVRYIARELHRTAPNRMWEIWILSAVGTILQLDIRQAGVHIGSGTLTIATFYMSYLIQIHRNCIRYLTRVWGPLPHNMIV